MKPMNKILVIHPFDHTTSFLEDVYIDLKCTIIDSNVSKSMLKKQIKLHDIIIMLGHGTEHGLIGYNRLFIDSSLVYLLREKTTICIWCNADKFVDKYNLKSILYTGMIISELDEANVENVITNIDDIRDSNYMLTKAFKRVLRNLNTNLCIDIDLLLKSYMNDYNGLSKVNKVIEYNRERIYKPNFQQ